mmetsp:Transcript_2955/g.4426  ORF Transcript_2955/g.4426 Transcript_2955/m.4426 type:complete len:223 (-) Transcript_2955:263-931(-)
MMLLVQKHVTKINNTLHGSRNTERNGGTNKTQSIPGKGTSKDKEPIQYRIDTQEKNIIVHGWTWQSLGLKIKSHALIDSIWYRPDQIVFRIDSSQFRGCLRKPQFQEDRFDVKQSRQTRQHTQRQPKHGLLQPNTRHFGIATAHGLSYQRIQNLIKGQWWCDANVGHHVRQDGGGEIGRGRVLFVPQVTDKGTVHAGHGHPTKKRYSQRYAQLRHFRNFVAP